MMKSANEKFLYTIPTKVGLFFNGPPKPDYAASFENFKTWDQEHSKILFGHQLLY